MAPTGYGPFDRFRRYFHSNHMKGGHMIETCKTCASENTVSIDLKLSDGTQVRFVSCHRCESREWKLAQGQVSLEKVLQLTASHLPR